jgi:signal transduction histidine kinase
LCIDSVITYDKVNQQNTPFSGAWSHVSKIILSIFTGFLLFISYSVIGSELGSEIVKTERTHLIDKVDVIFSTDKTPPIGSSDWLPLSLPFDLRGIPVNERPKSIWIRVPRTSNASGLYIERYQNAVRVFLDSGQIGGFPGEFTRRMSYWNTPLLVSIPRGGDYLYLNVIGHQYGPILAPLKVGDLFVLNSSYEDRYFWQVTTSRWSTGICLALAFFTLWLWLLRRQDTLFLKYTGACLSWSIVSAYLSFSELPLDWSTMLVLLHLSVDFTILLLFSFINQATQLNARRIEGVWLIVCALAIPLYIAISPNYFFQAAYTIHFVGILFLLFALVASVINVVRFRKPSGIWVAVALFGIIGLALRDSWIFLFLDTDVRLGYSNLSQFTGVFILLSLFGYLSHRFVSALNESETLNRELEARVNRKAEELEVIYDRSLSLEVAESASREREKIYRDLHDDVGAKLVSIIQTEQNRAASDLARSALESLRAAIFQAKYPDVSLNQLLIEYEEETRLRTEASGTTLEWRGDITKETLKLPNPGHYHLARILREAVSNSLRADRQIFVSLALDHHQLLVSISNPSDTGMTTTSVGFGIENIRYRAAVIGATVDWQHHDGLFTFKLKITIPESISEAKATSVRH